MKKLNLKNLNIKNGDLILIAVILVFTIFLFLPSSSSSNKLKANIYSDGELVQTISLSSVTESYEFEINGCTLLVESDGVSFAQSTCSDLLCVKRGKLSVHGAAMACLPNTVVIEITEESSSFDAVAY